MAKARKYRRRTKAHLRQYIGVRQDIKQQATQVRQVLDSFELHLGDGAALEQDAAAHWMEFDSYNGQITERGFCAYIRHNHSNYDALMREVNAIRAPQIICDAFRLLVNAEIITAYGLNVNAFAVTFTDDAYDNALAFKNKKRSPEEIAYHVLGIQHG